MVCHALPTVPLLPALAPRVLFVDDDPGMLKVLRLLVARLRPGWEAEFVDSGAWALEALRSRPFDVMVTDLEMPELDGLTLLERVAAEHPSLGRVVHSAASCLFDARRLAAVADAVVDKPADPRVLLAAVDRAHARASSSALAVAV